MGNFKFTAFKCSFQGIPGYMIKQIQDERMVVEQFISEADYERFCEIIGVIPIIIEKMR